MRLNYWMSYLNRYGRKNGKDEGRTVDSEMGRPHSGGEIATVPLGERQQRLDVGRGERISQFATIKKAAFPLNVSLRRGDFPDLNKEMLQYQIQEI